ncbi:MAG: efflux transporter outer membrane subunit, partial [Syntrophobacteraceae bacterium]
MRKHLFSILAFAAVLLSGCTLAPDYTRPEAPVPQAWPGGEAYKDPGREAPSAVSLQWGSFFTDPRLREIVRTALENNRDLRLSSLNVEKARAMYRIQQAELIPSAGGSASGSRARTPGDLTSSGHATTGEQWSVGAGISAWEIDFFGRIRSMAQSALESYFASDHARRSAQILLVSEVANAWLALAADRENLKLARSTLESQQASYNLIKRRHEVGISTELDLRQVQTRVESARVDVAKYTGLIAQDENALNLLAGSPVRPDLLPEGLGAVAPMPDVSPGLSSSVLLYRPDILEAESTLKAAYADIGAARAALFPRISLTTALGTASADLTGLFQAGSFAWNYAPQMTMPIFDPRAWAALRVTKVNREIAVAQYEKAIQAAFREVADELAKRGTLGDQIGAQQSLVDATAESYRLSSLRYDKGTDTYLNVLDAQRSLYGAQQGLISLQLAKLSNQVTLYKVLG